MGFGQLADVDDRRHQEHVLFLPGGPASVVWGNTRRRNLIHRNWRKRSVKPVGEKWSVSVVLAEAVLSQRVRAENDMNELYFLSKDSVPNTSPVAILILH